MNFIFRVIIAAFAILLQGCGGTFTLRPDGSISYTTKEILKAPIVEVEK
jgi:hypothetical protein